MKIFNGWKLLTIFAKNSILDISQGFEKASANYCSQVEITLKITTGRACLTTLQECSLSQIYYKHFPVIYF